MIQGYDLTDLKNSIELIQRRDWYRTVAMSDSYPILDNDRIKRIEATTGAGDLTYTLPTLADNPDRVIEVFKTDHSAGNIIVDGEGAETINGLATVKTNLRYSGFRLKAQSSEWHCELIRNEKCYYAGTNYNGVALDVTGTNFTKVAAATRFYPYQMLDGSYMLRFNIIGTISAAVNTITLTIAPLACIAWYSYQPIYVDVFESGVGNRTVIAHRAVPWGSTIAVIADGNFDYIHLAGDLPITAKPTWAD